MSHEQPDGVPYDIARDTDLSSRFYAQSTTSWGDLVTLQDEPYSWHDELQSEQHTFLQPNHEAPTSSTGGEDYSLNFLLAEPPDSLQSDGFFHDTLFDNQQPATRTEEVTRVSPYSYDRSSWEELTESPSDQVPPHTGLSPWTPFSVASPYLPALSYHLGDSQSETSELPDIGSEKDAEHLVCHELNCNAVFSGSYRKGNLARHIRLFHRREQAEYPCMESTCNRVFKRQDARLKHCRKHHPHIALPAPNRRRMRSRSTYTLAQEAQEAQRSERRQSETTPLIELHSSRQDNLASENPMIENAPSPLPSIAGRCSTPQLLPDTQQSCLIAPSQFDDVPSIPGDDYHATDDSRLTCSLCDGTFQRLADLRRHVQKHKEPVFTCEVSGCAREFYRLDKLRDHVRQAHKGNVSTTNQGSVHIEVGEEMEVAHSSSHTCTLCGIEFKTQGQLNSHHNRKHNQRFKCDECDKAFSLRADLRRHEATVHKAGSTGNFSSYPCPATGCVQTFLRRDNLLRHMRKTHPDHASSDAIRPLASHLASKGSGITRVSSDLATEGEESRQLSKNSVSRTW